LGWAQESTFEGLTRGPIFQAHIRLDLAEDTRSLAGQLDIYTYAAMAEDEFVRREAQVWVRSGAVGASSYQPRSSLCFYQDTEGNNNIIYSSMLTRDEKKDVQHDVHTAPLDLYPSVLLTSAA
jgi:hypothetical protein